MSFEAVLLGAAGIFLLAFVLEKLEKRKPSPEEDTYTEWRK